MNYEEPCFPHTVIRGDRICSLWCMLTPGQRQLVAFSRNIPFLQHWSCTHPVLNSTNKAASEFVDDKIKSKVDTAALAWHGVNVNHPCIMIYTNDEVPANRKFLAASAICFSTRRFLDVCLYNPCCRRPWPDLLM